MSTRKIAYSAVLLAVSMIIGVIENLVPPLIPILPYVKIGFSNVVIIVAIILLDYRYALGIISIKSVLVPIFIGNPIMILYSLPSVVISTIVSALLVYTKKFGIPTISMVSAVVFNFVQLTVAVIMTNYLVFGYLPYFIIIGSVAGLITGMIAYLTVKYIPKKMEN